MNIFKKTLFWGRFFLSFSIIIYLFSILNQQGISQVFSRINLAFVWIVPLLLLLGIYFAAIRWHILLAKLKIFQSITQSFRFYLVGSFYSIILPGVIGGDAIRITLASSYQKQFLKQIATSVFIERVLGFVVVLLVGCLGTKIIPQAVAYNLGISIIKTLWTIAATSLVTLFIIYNLVQRLSEALFIKWEQNKLLNFFVSFFKLLRIISPDKLLLIALWTLISQLSDIVASFILARSIGIYLPLFAFFVLIPIVYIATILPISLGGLGVREGVLSYLLLRLGVVPADAVTLSLLIYLNRLFIALIGGLIQFSSPKNYDSHQGNK